MPHPTPQPATFIGELSSNLCAPNEIWNKKWPGPFRANLKRKGWDWLIFQFVFQFQWWNNTWVIYWFPRSFFVSPMCFWFQRFLDEVPAFWRGKQHLLGGRVSGQFRRRLQKVTLYSSCFLSQRNLLKICEVYHCNFHFQNMTWESAFHFKREPCTPPAFGDVGKVMSDLGPQLVHLPTWGNH